MFSEAKKRKGDVEVERKERQERTLKRKGAENEYENREAKKRKGEEDHRGNTSKNKMPLE